MSLTLLLVIVPAVRKLYSLGEEVAGASADVAAYFRGSEPADVANVLRAVDQQSAVSGGRGKPPQGLRGVRGGGGGGGMVSGSGGTEIKEGIPNTG